MCAIVCNYSEAGLQLLCSPMIECLVFAALPSTSVFADCILANRKLQSCDHLSVSTHLIVCEIALIHKHSQLQRQNLESAVSVNLFQVCSVTVTESLMVAFTAFFYSLVLTSHIQLQ